nr:ATP-binding protein [Sporosarcina limicola]
MLDNIHLVRETCNELRPPFLNELGVVQSIHNLIEQTKLRCTFLLISELDPSIQKLDKEVELTLYRVIQELLNNAMKHSLASKVEVSLRKNNQVLSLAYDDNGKGIDMAELDDSFNTMGIFGMKARVKNGGGTIEINSSQGQGMHVYIEFKEVHGVKKN